MVTEYVGDLAGQGLRLALVVSRFNDLVTERLLSGAIDALERHGVDRTGLTVVRVPGAFEIPLGAGALVATERYDAVVCLGCLIRGATPHFDMIASAVTKKLLDLSVESGVPVSFGVLTCDTLEQALERAGSKAGNKGVEAALAALEMARLVRTLDSA